jgi:nucleotide-binding universal stress UspA family protein
MLGSAMFDNVIIGVDDLEGGRDALALARQLASPDRHLTLAYVQVVMPRPDDDSGAVSLAADRRPALERLESLRDASHIGARVLAVQAGSVAAGLHELASRRDADLLVIGASRRDRYKRMLVRDDTRAVLENPPCPVAVAPLGYARRPSGLNRIGAGYDGSPDSENALALARVLAREHDGRVSAFRAVPEPLRVRDAWDPQPEIDEGVAQARQRLAELGDLEPYAASADDAAEGLARYGASVDLLIVGSHEYRPIDRLLSGSTAQRLADEAPCPLLVLSSRRAATR